jgi:hypothetical protein
MPFKGSGSSMKAYQIKSILCVLFILASYKKTDFIFLNLNKIILLVTIYPSTNDTEECLSMIEEIVLKKISINAFRIIE